MKAGLAFFVFAMRAIRDADMPVARKVVLQLNSDEEVGSHTSRALTEREAKKSAAVLVLEPGTGLEGKLKTARKGVGGFRVAVHGKSSHAGVDFAAGASAIDELAYQIEKIRAFTDLARGITVNTGLIAGGTRTNVVAAGAHAEIDFRIPRLRDYAAQNLSVTGMGTTVTAALVKGDTAYIAQVGDSRAYLVRGDSIRQLTKDQTLAQYLSELTPDKPISAKLNNVLMQAVGLEPHLTATVSQIKLRQGDCLLLCSDGLTNKLDEMEIVQVLQEVHNVQVAARWLVAQANQRGGEDNITVVLARFEGNGLTPQSQSWNTANQTGWKLPAAA